MYLPNSVKSKAGHSVKPTGINHKLSMSEQKKIKVDYCEPWKATENRHILKEETPKGLELKI